MTDQQDNFQPGLGSYFKALIMICIIALGWLLLSQYGITQHLSDYSWVKDRFQQYGIYGPLFFIGIFGLSTVIGIPRLLISAIAGFAFDLIPAIIIALATTMVGCIASFFYARFMGRELVRGLMSFRMRNFEKLLNQNGFLAGIAIRALPVSNNTIVNLLVGITGVNPIHYFAGSLVGYLPLTVVFVLVGSGVQQDAFARILLSLVLYLVVVIPIGYLVQKRIRLVSTDH